MEQGYTLARFILLSPVMFENIVRRLREHKMFCTFTAGVHIGKRIVLDRDKTLRPKTGWVVRTPSMHAKCSLCNDSCWHSCRNHEKMCHENVYHETLILYCTIKPESCFLALLLGFFTRIVSDILYLWYAQTPRKRKSLHVAPTVNLWKEYDRKVNFTGKITHAVLHATNTTLIGSSSFFLFVCAFVPAWEAAVRIT